ncbi:uncharacterized protein [Aquarana catesbeiana]|uniref:uncharacterized protein n=1 Tax=Aquarana catesbeiana TaxID=8400 RepID=UPI003CC9F23B
MVVFQKVSGYAVFVTAFFYETAMFAEPLSQRTDGETCGEKQVSGTIGGRVTLRVDVADIEYISWVAATTSIQFLAKTEPGKPVVTRHSAYIGRVKATADGSLIITSLTRKDEGQFTANVQRFELGQCLLKFHLRVFGVLNESCAEWINVSGVKGGEATLPLDLTGFTSITWVTVNDLVHFAVTELGKPVLIQDDQYKGRLNVTTNGSLIITGLTKKDQGTYGSYTVTPTSLQCAQLYNLTVLDTQSRDSYVTHAASVGKEFTSQGFTQMQTRVDYTTENTIRLVISGCVLLIACCVFTHHMKTEVMSPSTNTQRHWRSTRVL